MPDYESRPSKRPRFNAPPSSYGSKPNRANGKPASQSQQQRLGRNKIKSLIRNMTRKLERDDLKADDRVATERALKGYQDDLARAEVKSDRSEIIKKYHFVRFIERKTAEKELKRLQRLISSEPTSDSPIPPATLPTALHIARANIAYTRFSPLAEKYIAIYPAEKSKKKTRSSGDADASDDEAEEVELDYTKRQAPTYPHLMLSKEGKPERWLDVEACLTPVKDISEANDKTISNFSGAELKKLNLLRDRDLPQVPQTTRSSQKDSTAAVAQDKKAKDVKYPAGKDTAKDKAKSTDAPKEDNRRKRREAARAAEAVREVEMKDDDGNSSDGGFFE